MKYFLYIFLVLSVKLSLSQTSADRYEVSAAGGDATTTSGGLISFTVGGLVVETSSTSTITVTQGFEQPDDSEGSNSILINNNAFSPDGDGVNDFWIVDLPEVLLNVVDLTILNRWGDKITYVEDYNNTTNVWDGTYQGSGEPVVAGTYFYIFESSETGQKTTGWVQVVRNN